MHPSDNTCTVLIDISLVKSLSDKLVCDESGLPYYFKGKNTALIELINDNF